MSICPRCASQFTCAMADNTGQPCWCTTLPIAPVLPIYPELAGQSGASCFCPICLKEWSQSAATENAVAPTQKP
ncbi:cysteine-rich CWC family protein [Sapientia aquatica]|uniref:Cysteine-rich CWC family protein n=1 Tax=Sapientia aquatica TaxID=1549640 RepID=A0A4R5W1H8_9BURK|nr:cysteine-rich CWC family protein [Sapientia aquatica]TDK65874.1 hypothetical protein E2I14_09710 [Sapientia aquatica]